MTWVFVGVSLAVSIYVIVSNYLTLRKLEKDFDKFEEHQ